MLTNSSKKKATGLQSNIYNLKKQQIDEESLNELRQAFDLFDTQQTGQIDARELKAIMRAFGIEVKKQYIKEIFRELGKDITEQISFQEFTSIMIPRVGDKESKEEIERIFNLFDEDKTGKISFKNLKKIALEIGEQLSDEELYEMLEEADKDNDGCINFEEFYRVMKKRNSPLDDFDSDDD